VIEKHERELVVARHQLEVEAVECAPRVLQPLAHHAVADIEQNGEADRHALAGELRDGLREAVFEDLEVVLREIRHEPAAGVGDRGGDRDDLDAGLELRRLRRGLRPNDCTAREDRGRRRDERHEDRMAPPRPAR
jgi:hypothetical protein